MFTSEGQIKLPPMDFYQQAKNDPVALIDNCLINGVPHAFQDYKHFCEFTGYISERLGIHPKAIITRGSAHLGYSITPKFHKAWKAFRLDSDIDLAIVDEEYFYRLDSETQRWENAQQMSFANFRELQKCKDRQRYRQAGYLSDYILPNIVGVHHKNTFSAVDTSNYCSHRHTVNAFVFKDWWSVRKRYEHDIKQLVQGVQNRTITPPP